MEKKSVTRKGNLGEVGQDWRSLVPTAHRDQGQAAAAQKQPLDFSKVNSDGMLGSSLLRQACIPLTTSPEDKRDLKSPILRRVT